jgi:hypothetical protein
MTSNIKGRTVTAIRDMTQEDIEANGWDHHYGPVKVIEFDHGHVVVFAMSDDEGNAPGVLVWVSQEGDGYV